MCIPMIWYWLVVAIALLLICVVVADHYEKEAINRRANKEKLDRIKAERALEHARKHIRKIEAQLTSIKEDL